MNKVYDIICVKCGRKIGTSSLKSDVNKHECPLCVLDNVPIRVRL
jgi:DNA-directed RNA polymerase subunit RPC12/RpoP